MKDFEFALKTKFIFNSKAEELIGKKLNGKYKKILIHHDDGAYLENNNLLKNIKNQLETSNIEYIELGGVQPNPRLTKVKEGIKLAKQSEIDCVLAIGGGSVIDSAKAIAVGGLYNGDVWDFFKGLSTVQNALPVVVLLTNPATGSESSLVTVVYNEETQEKIMVSSSAIQPEYSFMNPNLTVSLPKRVTANGIVDMFSHIFERYFNEEENFGIIDGMAEGAMRSIVEIGTRLINDLDNYNLRSEIMWAGTIAHNNTFGVGRNQDWATHVIANELSALYDVPHGESLSIIKTAWMEYVYQFNIPRFARYGRNVFNLSGDDQQVALESITKTKEFFIDIDMPTSFTQAKVRTDELDKLTDMVQYYPSGNIGALKALDKQDVLEIFKKSV